MALADDDGPVQWGQGTPPGFRSERRTTGTGRVYVVYVPPSGPQAYSLREAWRRYCDAVSAEGVDDDAESVPRAEGGGEVSPSGLDGIQVPGEAGPSAAGETVGSPESSGGAVAATPSRRQGVRSARARMPPGGRHGEEDLASLVVYADRPSARRAPVQRHA